MLNQNYKVKQRECPRGYSITGAYKTTPVKRLEPLTHRLKV